MPNGFYERVDSKAQAWIVPKPQKLKLDALQAELEMRLDFGERNGKPNEAKTWGQLAKNMRSDVKGALSGIKDEIAERTRALGYMPGKAVIERDPERRRLKQDRARLKRALQWWTDNAGRRVKQADVPPWVYPVPRKEEPAVDLTGAGESPEGDVTEKVRALQQRVAAIQVKRTDRKTRKLILQIEDALRSGHPNQVALAEKFIGKLEQKAGR